MANSFGSDVLIQAPDPKRAAEFYVEHLGFEITDESPELVSLLGRHINLYIESGPALGPVLEVTVDSVEAAKRLLVKSGCQVVKDEPEFPRCYIRDPFGLMYNLKSWSSKLPPRIHIVMSQEKATFGAGCFWGVEAAFAAIPGVTATAVGYEGGALERPSYKDVCTDQTGHAEVVEVDFDPDKVSFEQLLDAFFSLHDPTTLNRQGPDWGTQYRSAIFFHSPKQEAQARAKIDRLSAEGSYKPKRIVTKVEPSQTFWRAEEYHQRYLEKRGQGSCHI